MSSSTLTTPQTVLGAQAVVQSLLRNGIDTGFGIPSIHNIALYEVLRQARQFHHWVVRHEQAAGYAADGYYRQSGRVAVVFASTGPGNLFTVVPLLEALQTNTPCWSLAPILQRRLNQARVGHCMKRPSRLTFSGRSRGLPAASMMPTKFRLPSLRSRPCFAALAGTSIPGNSA